MKKDKLMERDIIRIHVLPTTMQSGLDNAKKICAEVNLGTNNKIIKKAKKIHRYIQ